MVFGTSWKLKGVNSKYIWQFVTTVSVTIMKIEHALSVLLSLVTTVLSSLQQLSILRPQYKMQGVNQLVNVL